MSIPNTIEPPTASACFQAGMSSRTSRTKRGSDPRARSMTRPPGAKGHAASRSGMVHHGAPDRLTIRGRVETGDDAAARHRPDPVGNAEHLVEILADQHDGGARIAGGKETPVHRGVGPHVQSAGRTVRDNDGGFAAQLAAISFWALPPDNSAAPGCRRLRTPCTSNSAIAASVARTIVARSIQAGDPNLPSWMNPIA